MYLSSLASELLFVSCGSCIALNRTVCFCFRGSRNVTVQRVVRQLPASPTENLRSEFSGRGKYADVWHILKYYLLQRLPFGERDRHSGLNSSRRWSVISPSLHNSPVVVSSFCKDGLAVLTSWNVLEFVWIVFHSVGFKAGLTGFRRCLFSRLKATHRLSALVQLLLCTQKLPIMLCLHDKGAELSWVRA
jgi:hypothetical protein